MPQTKSVVHPQKKKNVYINISNLLSVVTALAGTKVKSLASQVEGSRGRP